MGSTFGGISTALSALYTQRRALDVTGQNIANANTEGYSRQRVDMGSVGGSTTPAMYATPASGGGGVQVTDVVRLRDNFMESRARTERGQDAYLSDQKQVYGQIETVIGEPSDTGLQAQMAQFWSSLHDVANRPGDTASRTQMLARANTVATGLNSAAGRLESVFGASRSQLDSYTTDLNSTATAVADLNEAIVSAKQAGLPSNELMDRRDMMVLHLSELTGGTARTRVDGAVDFSINGMELVTGADARQVQAYGGARIQDQPSDPVGLRFTDTGAAAMPPSGTLASTLQTLSTTIPNASASLDTVAAALATSVNAAHSGGYDLNGNPGTDLFTSATGTVTASTIAVAIIDPALVAASGSPSERLDGSNADAMASLATAAGGADKTYRQFVVDLGVSAQTVNRRASIQAAVTQDVEAARTSQSGVNLDEEMTNMLTFQRGYEAAAQVMKAADSMLETLMNSIGR
jgi:flagellar hook-associated protein 1 FlgK